jgi:hypothetical protein
MHKLTTTPTTRPRRWTRRPHIDGYDIVVWCAFSVLSAAIVLAFCAVAWIAS